MPFRHPDRSHGLSTRIEHEVRERLEEAVDYVCLEALVRARRAHNLPAPVADNAADRREYVEHVRTFLAELEHDLTANLDAQQRRRLPASAAGDDEARRMQTQVALARMLPDYWQRFDAVRARYLAEPADPSATGEGSGSEGRGLLARLFGR